MPVAPGPVVDVDVHIHELDSDLAPYFEMPWRRVLEEGGLARQGARSIKGERFLDYPGYSPLSALDPILGELPGEPHRITSPEILRADLDERGVQAAIIYTGRLLRAATSHDHNYLTMLGRAYNRCLAERWLDPARGIHGAIMAVNQSPEDAAEEIEKYAKQDGFVAVYLPMAGNYPLWGDRGYDPIFATAQEADLPVVLQGAFTIATVFPYELHHLPTALAKQTLSQAFGALANLVSMVTTGVLARFPKLKIIFQDDGISWLPLALARLDHYYEFLREEVPFLESPPSEQIRRQVYLTTHPLEGKGNPRFLAACLEAIGLDHLLYGSDWPHFDATAPSEILDLPIDDAAKRGILGGNARRVFGLAERA
ncbi:MAG: amidohydrolase family protein [Chloroflexota bacterium]